MHTLKTKEFHEYLLTQKHVANLTAETYVKDILSHQQLALMLPLTNDKLDALLEPLHQHRSKQAVLRITSAFHSYNDFLTNNNDNLTEEEIQALLQQPNMETFAGIRDKAILELLCATGIHVSELIALNVGNINVTKGTVNITEAVKGCKTREIPVNNQTMLYICTYMIQMRVREKDTPLFCNHHNGKRLSRSWIWKIVKKHGAAANIQREISPSDLRKAYATQMYKNGSSLINVQEVLGISDYQDMGDYYSEYYQRAK